MAVSRVTFLCFLVLKIAQPGRSCNFDFEYGDHDGWTTTGTAFNNQPTYGDNPTARNRGEPANQQGDWWIGGYEYRQRRNFQVVKKATGKCTETMARESWDVREYVGQTAHLRLVDASSGGWGHINFDDLYGDIDCNIC